MRSALVFLCLVLPVLASFFLEPTQILSITIGNLSLIYISLLLLKKYSLTKTHFNVILVFITFISIISLVSYHQSVTSGSVDFPYIPGGDGEKYYVQARYLAMGNPLDAPNMLTLNYLGYQIILGFWFKLIGANLFKGLLLNYGVLTISIILLSISTYLLTENKKISYYTLILSLCCSHFIVSGMMLLKDVFFHFSFSLVLFTMVNYYKGSKSPLLLINLIFVGLIIGSLRLPFLVILPIISLLIGPFFKPGKLILLGIMVVGLVVALPVFLNLTKFTFSKVQVSTIVMETSFVEDELKKAEFQGGAVQRLIGGYTSMPTIKRIALLPIPFIIQFVTPFKFWGTEFISDHIYYLFYQLNILWYGVIGILMFIVVIKWKHINNPNLRNLFIFGLVMYAFMAFIYGGTIPRYAMPFILFMMPSMGYVVYLCTKSIQFNNFVIKFYRSFYAVAFVLFCLYLSIKIL